MLNSLAVCFTSWKTGHGIHSLHRGWYTGLRPSWALNRAQRENTGYKCHHIPRVNSQKLRLLVRCSMRLLLRCWGAERGLMKFGQKRRNSWDNGPPTARLRLPARSAPCGGTTQFWEPGKFISGYNTRRRSSTSLPTSKEWCVCVCIQKAHLFTENLLNEVAQENWLKNVHFAWASGLAQCFTVCLLSWSPQLHLRP